MNRNIFVAIILVTQLIISSCCLHESDAYAPPVTDTAFTNSDEAWVLTRKGVLKRISIDGQSINVSDSQQRVEGMSFISPSQGWTVDSDWNIWHFDGAGWKMIGHNDDHKFGLIWPSSVSFVDENVGWARTLEGLFVTEDGGRTWNKVLVTEPGEFLRLYVIDRDSVFLSEGHGSIKQTTDRGKTWKDIDLGLRHGINSFACRNRDSRECWAANGGELFAINGEAPPKRVLFPTPKEMFITYIYPFGDGGLLVSGFTLVRNDNPLPSGVLLKTSDKGATWQHVDVPLDDHFEQVTSFGNTIWLASHKAIYRSLDDGSSWSKVYDGNNL